ncbi:MAG: SRPBCC family protein [Pyrinomonadaceae bacterium]|nr:SRPBCC family protein [Pyrinomonadaceae bacterium]
MAEHILIRSFDLDRPRKEVFEFFADAGNLELITPPELNFRILSDQPINIRQGTLIDYKLRLRGIPIAWKTEISVWNPPYSFTDRALKSPYRQWIHRHNFTELSENRTRIEDEVRYRLPLEPLGDLFYWLVRRELDHIFDYREKTVAEFFAEKSIENNE